MNDIGWAVKQLWYGEMVRRAGWNGKGMFLLMNDCAGYPETHYDVPTPAEVRRLENVGPANWIGMKTADNKFVPWLCSQTDLLATDWEIAD